MKRYLFSQNLEEILDKAEEITAKYKNETIEQIHLLYSIIQNCTNRIDNWLKKQNIDKNKLMEQIVVEIEKMPESENPGTKIGEKTKDILELSSIIALNTKSKKIEPFHLFLAIIDEPDFKIEKIFDSMHIELGNLEDIYYIEELKKNYMEEQSSLIKYGVNVNKLVSQKNVQPFTENWKITDKLLEILSRDIKNLPVIVGSLGLDKDVLIEGLSKKLKTTPEKMPLANHYVIRIMTDSIIADSKDASEFVGNLRSIITDAEQYSNVILYFDELFPDFYKAGKIDILLLLKPSLSRRNIKIIGFTKRDYMKNYFDENSFFKKKIELVKLKKVSKEKAFEVLENYKDNLEERELINLSQANLKYLYQMVKRYITTNNFLEESISLLDMVSTNVNIKKQLKNRKTKIIRKRDINETIAEYLDIPLGRVERSKKYFKNMEKSLHENIIGQKKAIESILNTIKMKENFFNLNPNLPDGIFLFVGPRGVGKKKLMRELSKILYNDKNRITFLDMNKFSKSESVFKLLGMTDSSSNNVYPSVLTKIISKYPYSILFLDEIDKASEEVLSIFKDIFKTGTFEDNFGNTVNFKGITIIMTVKAYQEKKKQLGFKSEEIYEYNDEEVKEGLKKIIDEELIHIADNLVIFNYLNDKQMKIIIRKNLKNKLNDKIQTNWVIGENIIEFLLDKIKKDPEKLRAMDRIFQKYIFSFLAINIKSNDIFQNDEIQIKYQKGNIEII